MTVLICGSVLQALYGVAGYQPRHLVRLLARPGCFLGGNVWWVVFSVLRAADRAGRDVVGGARSPPRPRPTDAAGAGCLRPGAVASGSMARLSTYKAPKIAPPESARPRRPTDGRRRTDGRRGEGAEARKYAARARRWHVASVQGFSAGRAPGGSNGVRRRRNRS
jgi:hypothetical protein